MTLILLVVRIDNKIGMELLLSKLTHISIYACLVKYIRRVLFGAICAGIRGYIYICILVHHAHGAYTEPDDIRLLAGLLALRGFNSVKINRYCNYKQPIVSKVESVPCQLLRQPNVAPNKSTTKANQL